jgi:hypothetical protein
VSAAAPFSQSTTSKKALSAVFSPIRRLFQKIHNTIETSQNHTHRLVPKVMLNDTENDTDLRQSRESLRRNKRRISSRNMPRYVPVQPFSAYLTRLYQK